jgi:hypothetical protein
MKDARCKKRLTHNREKLIKFTRKDTNKAPNVGRQKERVVGLLVLILFNPPLNPPSGVGKPARRAADCSARLPSAQFISTERSSPGDNAGDKSRTQNRGEIDNVFTQSRVIMAV